MTISQADFDLLKAEVAQLRAELGAKPDFQRDGYLDNPVHTRMHEIGLAIDADVQAVGSFDGRLKAVESHAANSSGGSVDVVAELAARKVFITPYGVGFGIAPDPNSQSGLTVGGDWAAEITGISNTRGDDKQNPGEVHKNSLVIADGDGGMRARQYVVFKPSGGGAVPNTTNRPGTTFTFMDSWGDCCISDNRAPHGQVFYLVKSPDTQTITIAAYQVGWKVRMVESVTQYGAADKLVAGE